MHISPFISVFKSIDIIKTSDRIYFDVSERTKILKN